MVYALGFTLEKVAAMQEHGIRGQVPLTQAFRCSHMSTQSISKEHGYA